MYIWFHQGNVEYRRMTDLLATAVKNNLGLHLLHWAITHSDFWHLANRCSQLVQKINEPLEKSAHVLDNLLTMDEDDFDAHCIGLRDLHLHRMHFDDEDDYNDQDDRRRYEQQNVQNITQSANRTGKKILFSYI